MSKQVRLVLGLTEDAEWVIPALVWVDPITGEYFGEPEDYYFNDGFDLEDMSETLSDIQEAFDLPVLNYPKDFLKETTGESDGN